MTTPALRSQALAAKFGNVYYEEGDGYGYARTLIDDLTIYADAIGDDMSVTVYGHGERRALLRLSSVRDDDLVASIIQQVVDHHNGRQVV